MIPITNIITIYQYVIYVYLCIINMLILLLLHNYNNHLFNMLCTNIKLILILFNNTYYIIKHQ